MLGVLKWPVGVLSLLALPLCLIAGWKLLVRIWHEPTPAMAFIVGLVVYFLLWYLILRRRLFGSFFSTLEHELTHALFAILTLHRVTGLKSTFTRGGHMTYVTYGGAENWLIGLAPYFFPTVSIAILLVLGFVPIEFHWWAEWLLGAATAYHVTSTMHETHAGQTDLQRAGYLFCALFLPTANIISFGMIFAFSHAGWPGILRFFQDFAPPFIDH